MGSMIKEIRNYFNLEFFNKKRILLEGGMWELPLYHAIKFL